MSGRSKVALLLVLLPVGGFLVAASGIVPIKASPGHFAITRWFLQFSKKRSVATHTIGGEPLALDEPWLVMKGAGHYHSACLPCHGGPDRSYLQHVARAMAAPPPDLRARVETWEPDELFYVVKHGIKFTGMPAWPTQQRDDEVRAMVAFLRALPGLEPEEYRQLVHGDTQRQPPGSLGPLNLDPAALDARTAFVLCARCHGLDGRGRGNAAFPKLAGQRPEYLTAALRAYARGERHSGIMQPVAASLSPEEIAALAAFYAGLPAGERTDEPPTTAEVAAAIERGRKIATEGVPSQRVGSCVDCHGPGVARRNPAYPDLRGQYADYLLLQLQLFKAEQRGGSPYAHLMSAVAPRLTPDQMRDVALYYGSLHPDEDR